ncbi:MAG: aldehyde dehydrogenase family protein [Fimbriimonadaceae bacterium]|jgi:acyl-CoA reductase-like NAD-dependent aldehyde dehydrogenase|nr:aldehyde dehydrogenase family protein [Fimbriimonadaceae bacterium]
MHRELLIGGHFFGGPCDQSIGKDLSTNPFDGSLVGTVAEAGWAEVDSALHFAQKAFEDYRFSPRSQRQFLLRKIAASVRERRQELAELVMKEVGKPITLALAEVDRTAITFDLAGDLLTAPCGSLLPVDQDPRGTGYRCFTERVPLGPVLAIIPSNWPLNLAAHKLAPALAAGATVVVKAPGTAPLATLTLARIIHEAGCPDGVVNAVHCVPALAQKAVLDPRIKVLSFTGSEAVGWMLKSLVPEKKVILELGGDASVVFFDGNLEWACQRMVAGAFGYAGQVCISVQHARIHQDSLPEARERLIHLTDTFPTGDPSDPSVLCGPMITDEAADKVMDFLDEAVNGGASILAGGNRIGRMIEPTLIENVPAQCRLAKEEVFGPVLTLSSFETAEEALRQVNQSRYGIQLGIFTESMKLAEKIYREAQVGGVVVNDFPTLRFDVMPYGGVKRSGFGREGVASGYLELTEDKVMISRLVD